MTCSWVFLKLTRRTLECAQAGLFTRSYTCTRNTIYTSKRLVSICGRLAVYYSFIETILFSIVMHQNIIFRKVTFYWRTFHSGTNSLQKQDAKKSVATSLPLYTSSDICYHFVCALQTKLDSRTYCTSMDTCDRRPLRSVTTCILCSCSKIKYDVSAGIGACRFQKHTSPITLMTRIVVHMLQCRVYDRRYCVLEWEERCHRRTHVTTHQPKNGKIQKRYSRSSITYLNF